jgi:hypothetical protein
MADGQPLTPTELAQRTDCHERYIREWFCQQAASGYVEYDPSDGTFRLPPELNPVGRIFYGGSTMLCTPASLSQEVGLALGAQAGQRRLTEVLGDGGFSRVRRAAETPFNIVLEARP